MKEPKQKRRAASGADEERRFKGESSPGRGADSLVSMDNPDDSQLGADRVESRNPKQQM